MSHLRCLAAQVGLLQGDGAVGRLVVAHPLIAMVALTGSAPTGKTIMRAAADSLKRVRSATAALLKRLRSQECR
eukprot:2271368-Pleurochrysis_carterae.AAC.4